MKFINSKFEIIDQEPGLIGVYKQIEKAARVSYKSEDRITEGSAQKMVDTLIKNGHNACLEHGTIYLKWKCNDELDIELGKRSARYEFNKYSVLNYWEGWEYITTNARVIVENGWEDDLQYICEPTEHHEKRITVKFTTSLGIVREILRHRRFSFMNESTRYCNYSKDKFDNQLTFVIPEWIYNDRAELADSVSDHSWDWIMQIENPDDMMERLQIYTEKAAAYWDILSNIEDCYNFLVANGLKPEEARSILPLDLKSELVVTGFVDDWLHFFALRSYIAATGKPHPDLRILADGLMQEFLDRGYITNEDIDKLKDEKVKRLEDNKSN